MAINECSQCGAPLDGELNYCKYCGSKVQGTNEGVHVNAQPQQEFNQQQRFAEQQQVYTPTLKKVPVKSKVTAGILGILLGGIGIHKFYLGKAVQGILYLLFCWTYIPALIGFIEGIIYLTKSDDEWAEKVGYKLQ